MGLSGVAQGGGGKGAAAVGAPSQTPGRLRRKNVAGGSASRPPLGAQSPLLNGVWGGTPAGVLGQGPQLHSWGEAVPPAYMIQSSQPVWSAVESSNLSKMIIINLLLLLLYLLLQ